MRKYFFSRHNYHGQIWPFAWVEDNSIAVGGRPTCLEGRVIEITEVEFNEPLANLEAKYPLEVLPDEGPDPQ